MPVTNETEVMREMWRLAYSKPDGITIPCPDQASATRLRFALYNAVKQFRHNPGSADDQLANAITNCGLSIGNDRQSVVMAKKLDSATSKAMLALLGEQAPRSIEDVSMQESLERIMGKVQETLAPTTPVPEAPATIGAINASRYGARS